MSEQEIIEGSKLIAEFMEFKKYPGDVSPKDWYLVPENYSIAITHNWGEPMFHISWDWLFPVIEKIEKSGCIVEMWLSNARGCRIVKLMKGENWKTAREGMLLIECVWLAVVDFIKWYSENK